MEEIQLNVQTREKTGKGSSQQIRKAQGIPAVVYGEGQPAQALSIDRKTFERIERLHHGESFLLHLNVMKEGQAVGDYAALIKEIQYDPVSDQVAHVDFIRVSLKDEIEVKIPVSVKGDALGVKKGGSLDHHLWELDIICLPTSIPKNLSVDVSGLEIGDAIFVKDIVFPQGVRTEHDPEAIVISIVPPMKEEEATEAVSGEEVVAEPEIIKKEKKKKDEEEPQEGASKAQ